MSLVPIDEVVHVPDICTHDPATGAARDADSTPTFSVYEEATDTPILSAQSFTKRTSLTGDYRGVFTASAANGFEAGKWYNVVATATVAGITAKKTCMHFRVAPAESIVGVPKSDESDKTAIPLAMLKLDWTGITGEASRSMLNALRALRNRWVIGSGTLSVKKENDTTEAWQGAVTTSAGNPVNEIDPT